MYLSDNARVTRTLIVSFVVALAVMVPMKFYQVGENLAQAEMDQEIQTKVNQSLALRAENVKRQEAKAQELAFIDAQPSVLGASTENATGKTCMTAENANNLVASMYDSLEARGSNLTEEEVNAYVVQVEAVQKRVCNR